MAIRRTDLQAGGGITMAPGIGVGATCRDRLRSQYDGAEFLPPTFAPDLDRRSSQSLDTRSRRSTTAAS
jgi:hypothetical protein